METTIYKVRDPNGNIREIRGPAGASDAEVIAKAKELLGSLPPPDGVPGARQEPGFLTKLGRGVASLADVAVGGVIPGIAGQVAYPVARALGQSDKEATAITQKIVEPLSQPFGKAFGVVGTPEYETEASRRLMNFIGANVEKGSKWISQQTGLPEADVSNMIGTVALAAAPASTRAVKSAGARVAPVVAAVDESVANALAPAQQATVNALARVRQGTPVEPSMAGVGAAETAQALQRQATAESLRVPIKLTKGEATRLPGQQQFESETAKTYPETVGKPLIERQQATNEAILRNFDAYADATGATKYGADMLRPVGKVVDDALVASANKAKAAIKDAYAVAASAGELQAPVSYQPVFEYIQKQGPTVREKLAPILAGVEDQIRLNDPKGTGQISINAIEDVRKFINANTQEGTPNSVHAVQLKKLIDAATEGQGGELYQKARGLRIQYAKDFENAAFVDKLLSKKPGTTDRSVALEDVWNHAIMKGGLDDTRAVALALKKAGPEGQQAWRELQGQTIAMMQDAVTKGVSRDLSGNRIVSPAKFDSVVRELDSSGKLEYIFGKKGAQEVRDLRDTALDVYTKVPGAVNYSNTASTLARRLESLSRSPIGKVPIAKQALEYAEERARTNALTKQVNEALNYNALTK
jgi:hypothetical protein